MAVEEDEVTLIEARRYHSPRYQRITIRSTAYGFPRTRLVGNPVNREGRGCCLIV